MGTAYIRLKFTPVVKHFPRANSNNCWLEITPTISCIENLDKIEWNQQKGSVEYIVPMTYKIIVKKRESEHQIRCYYSCIDLLPSMSIADLSAGDVPRHISENFILSKTITQTFEEKPGSETKINSREPNIKPNKISSVTYSTSKVKLTEKDVKQVTNTIIECKQNKSIGTRIIKKHLQKDSILQEEKTIKQNKIDNSNNNDKNYSVYNLNGEDKNRKNSHKKLCITKVCNINTSDMSLYNNYAKRDFITMPSFNPSVNSFYNIQNKNIKLMEKFYRPLRDNLHNCFVRVEPEIRVAQFVEKMKKEVFPIKVLLNDILLKCEMLGLNKIMPSNVSAVRSDMTPKNKICEVQKKVQSNRVVYSIVFDS